MNHKHTESNRRQALIRGLEHLAFWAEIQKSSEKSITDILQALRQRVRKLEESIVAAGQRPPQDTTSSNTTQEKTLAFPG